MQREVGAFDAIAGFGSYDLDIFADGVTQRLQGARTVPGSLEALGIRPLIGRGLSPEDLEAAYHTHEVKHRADITVLMDAKQRGVGSAACGPGTLAPYKVLPGTYRLRYVMQ